MRLYPLPSCFSPRNSQTSNICSAAGMSEAFTDINLFSLHSSPVKKILLGALLTGKLRPRAGKSLARDDTTEQQQVGFELRPSGHGVHIFF